MSRPLRRRLRFAAALATMATMTMTSAPAAPAPWFLWASLVADGFVCAQNSPGEGWQQVRGPFRDAHCRKPGNPTS